MTHPKYCSVVGDSVTLLDLVVLIPRICLAGLPWRVFCRNYKVHGSYKKNTGGTFIQGGNTRADRIRERSTQFFYSRFLIPACCLDVPSIL